MLGTVAFTLSPQAGLLNLGPLHSKHRASVLGWDWPSPSPSLEPGTAACCDGRLSGLRPGLSELHCRLHSEHRRLSHTFFFSRQAQTILCSPATSKQARADLAWGPQSTDCCPNPLSWTLLTGGQPSAELCLLLDQQPARPVEMGAAVRPVLSCCRIQ